MNERRPDQRHPLDRVFIWSAIGGMLLSGGFALLLAGIHFAHEEVRAGMAIFGVIAAAAGGALLAPILIATRIR